MGWQAHSGSQGLDTAPSLPAPQAAQPRQRQRPSVQVGQAAGTADPASACGWRSPCMLFRLLSSEACLGFSVALQIVTPRVEGDSDFGDSPEMTTPPLGHSSTPSLFSEARA
jgi:hypothetical protein